MLLYHIRARLSRKESNMINNNSDIRITTDEIVNALRAKYETAQEMLTPLAEERIPPFDVLPAILSDDYNELLSAVYRFERDIAAINAYGYDVKPLEFDILKRHSDDASDLQNITNQLSDWLYAFSAGDADE